jgi:hypothetical protein
VQSSRSNVSPSDFGEQTSLWGEHKSNAWKVEWKIRGEPDFVEDADIIENGKVVVSITYKQGEVQEIGKGGS